MRKNQIFRLRAFKGILSGGDIMPEGGYPPFGHLTFCLRESDWIQTRGRATRHSKVDILAVILRRLRACGSKNSSQEVNRRPEVLDILSSKTVISLWIPLHTTVTTRKDLFKGRIPTSITIFCRFLCFWLWIPCGIPRDNCTVWGKCGGSRRLLHRFW